MKTPEEGRWTRTSPLAVVFFLGKLLRDLAKNAWQGLAPLAVVLATQGNLVDKLKMAGIVAGVALIVVSALRYWFFRFRLENDSILIREGVIKKKQIDIKFDRIQGISTQQNFIDRYFGLVTIRFETAGTSDDEGNLPAVRREFADSLRERIGRPLRQAPAETEEDIPGGPEPLIRLGWRDMVRIGVSDRRIFLVLAILGPIFEQLGEETEKLVESYIGKWIDGAMQFGAIAGFGIIASVVVAVIAVLMLFTVAAAFLRYHDFALSLDGRTLRSQGGLLTRHDVSMGLDKIQTLRLQQGIVLRWLSRFRMTARQARSSHKNDASKNFTIPVVTSGEAAELRSLMLEAEGKGLVQDPSSPLFAPISKYSMRLPFLLFFWMPPAWPLIYLRWRHAGYLFTDHGLVRRSGTIGYRTVALLYRKVQRVTIRQSPLQRRKGLATLRVYMASGSVKIPFIEHALARNLRDYILYKVESSTRAWH